MIPCARCGTFTPAQLAAAADRGENFERLECEACYGPGYVKGCTPCS